MGVAGFALNGGVHFGGYSALFGMAAENIIGATVVLADGIVVSLASPDTCDILLQGSSNRTFSKAECFQLLRALKGSGGGSIGVVTQLRMKVFEIPPTLSSALLLLTIDCAVPEHTAKAIAELFSSLPSKISTTLFGLDAYYKAYTFVALFAHKKFDYFLKSLSSGKHTNASRNSHMISFVVELSWLGDNDSTEAEIEKLCLLATQSYAGKRANMRIGAPVSTNGKLWSVPSYNLVWGLGHSYGGASIAGSQDYASTILETAFSRYKNYLSLAESKVKKERNGKCSDCVIVLHRVSDRIRATDFTSTSLNPAIGNLSIWVEMDCGHFYRQRGTWGYCSQWISETQKSLDQAAATISTKREEGIYHYPNVPHLDTYEWERAYYGSSNYQKLSNVKRMLDPMDVFYHRQSILASDADSALHSSRMVTDYGLDRSSRVQSLMKARCRDVYDKKLVISNFVLASKIFVGLLGTGALLTLLRKLFRVFFKT